METSWWKSDSTRGKVARLKYRLNENVDASRGSRDSTISSIPSSVSTITVNSGYELTVSNVISSIYACLSLEMAS